MSLEVQLGDRRKHFHNEKETKINFARKTGIPNTYGNSEGRKVFLNRKGNANRNYCYV